MSPARDPLEPSEAFKFPKLNVQNYANWSVHMQSALQAKYLWLIVNGTETCPQKPDDKKPDNVSMADWKVEMREYIEWMSRDEVAQGLMRGAVEESQWPHVTASKTSKEMWDDWKKVHQDNQKKINVHYFFEELYTRKYIDGSPMADHITAILNIKHKITQVGETIPDLHVARTMILSLPKTPSWDLIKIQLFDIETRAGHESGSPVGIPVGFLTHGIKDVFYRFLTDLSINNSVTGNPCANRWVPMDQSLEKLLRILSFVICMITL